MFCYHITSSFLEVPIKGMGGGGGGEWGAGARLHKGIIYLF